MARLTSSQISALLAATTRDLHPGDILDLRNCVNATPSFRTTALRDQIGSQSSVVQVGLAAEWLFLEGSGLLATDSLGGTDLTLTEPLSGGPTWLHGGLNFSNQGVLAPIFTGQAVLSPDYQGSFSIEMWVQFDDPGVVSYENWFAINDGNNNAVVFGRSDNTAQFEANFDDGSPGGLDLFVEDDQPLAQGWQHHVWIFNAVDHTIGFYLDSVSSHGLSADSAPGAVGLNSPGADLLVMGSDSFEEGLQGTIGECRVYHVALSEANVLNNFNATRSRYEA